MSTECQEKAERQLCANCGGTIKWNIAKQQLECASCRTPYVPEKNAQVSLAECRYFTTNLFNIDEVVERDFETLDSFVVYICMEGEASISDDKGNDLVVHQGQTVLLPADTKRVTLKPSPNAKFLETYIGDTQP